MKIYNYAMLLSLLSACVLAGCGKETSKDTDPAVPEITYQRVYDEKGEAELSKIAEEFSKYSNEEAVQKTEDPVIIAEKSEQSNEQEDVQTEVGEGDISNEEETEQTEESDSDPVEEVGETGEYTAPDLADAFVTHAISSMNIKIRQEPSTSSSIVGQLKAGAEVYITGAGIRVDETKPREGIWYPVYVAIDDSTEYQGYVRGDLLKEVPEEPEYDE